jgi:hypothetical protein
MSDNPQSTSEPAESPRRAPPDQRLYIPEPDGWQAQIKRSWDNEYCYAKSPGEDYFHLLLGGELYIQHGDEKYCLNCALRRGLITTNRLFWQKRGPALDIPEPTD